MFEKVLSKGAKESLALLSGLPLFKKAYLAGGTAAALQLGHRASEDFDFFIEKRFNAKIFAKKLAAWKEVKRFSEQESKYLTRALLTNY